MPRIKKEVAGAVDTILATNANYLALPVKVTGTGTIKAGTPLTGDLVTRGDFAVATDKATAVGLLLHDVKVEDTRENGTILLHGVVYSDKVVGYDATLKTALKDITFVGR